MFPDVRLAALVAACLISTGALAKTIVLRAAILLDMTGGPAHRADVVLDGERIAAVLAEGQGRGDRIVDLTGKFLLPGFADLHAHVLVHPVDAQGNLGPHTDRALSLATLKLLLAHGVTTVRDPGAETEAAVEYRKELATGTIPGPREAGIPRVEVLRIATRNAAVALRRESEQGTIEPGKRADLVVLSADPLADLHNTRLIELVFQGGREVDRAALLR